MILFHVKKGNVTVNQDVILLSFILEKLLPSEHYGASSFLPLILILAK